MQTLTWYTSPLFFLLHFQVWNSLKIAFWERKLLSLGEKRRFWTGNFCCSEEIWIFLYLQDLASFHRKKNHGSRYLPWIYFFSSSSSKLWIRVLNFLLARLLHRVDERARQEDFDQGIHNLKLFWKL